MKYYTRKETAAILGVSLSTLDTMRKNRTIGFYQAVPGGKLHFTQRHIEHYWDRIEKEPREKYARKPKKERPVL